MRCTEPGDASGPRKEMVCRLGGVALLSVPRGEGCGCCLDRLTWGARRGGPEKRDAAPGGPCCAESDADNTAPTVGIGAPAAELPGRTITRRSGVVSLSECKWMR